MVGEMLQWCGNGRGGGSPAPPPCSFSIFFPVSGKPGPSEEGFDGDTLSSSSSSSFVDCTLTLGTPYTRHISPSSDSSRMHKPSATSSLCWDMLPQQGKLSSPANAAGSFTVAGSSICGSTLTGDPLLLSRRCANCDTTSTPLWRNGPRGPKSLCNACGIRFKKEERRAVASSTVALSGGDGISYGYPLGLTQHPTWGCYAPAEAPVKGSAISVYDAGEVEDQRELYLPWKLNLFPTQYQ